MEDSTHNVEDLDPSERITEQWKQKLVDQHFPWHAAQHTSMPRFLSEYTVHDSYWLGFSIVGRGEGIAIIGWDTYWTGGRVFYPSEPGTNIPEPVLVLRFRQVYEISWYGAHTMINWCISGAESREGTDEEFARSLRAFGTQSQPNKETIDKLRNDGIYYTEFFPCLDGDPSTFSILHGGQVDLLCLNHVGEVLHIPDLH